MATDFNQETQYIDWVADISLHPDIPVIIMHGPGQVSEYYVGSTTYDEMLMLFYNGSWFLFDIKNKNI